MSLVTSTATGTIADDGTLSVSAGADAETVTEGANATFKVTVAGGTSTANLEVTYTVGGKATSATDYTAPPAGKLTLAAGASNGTITIPTLTDTVLDGGEDSGGDAAGRLRRRRGRWRRPRGRRRRRSPTWGR